jgi:uncharacterized protein with ParB-like and HNH nuclease domain
MIATETSLIKFLQEPMQLVITRDQHTYHWTEKQCQQLWDDIIRVAENESIPSHFIGSIIYVERGIFPVASVPRLLLLDGQQRLATISLLLAALGKALDGTRGDTDISRKQINDYFLFNSHESGELHYKLILSPSDRDTFIRLTGDRKLPFSSPRRLVKNYQFFEKSINKYGIAPNLLHHLYQGVAKLTILDISLDRQYDNPQLIYESLISTGLDARQTDLIHNWLYWLLSVSCISSRNSV